MNIILLFNFLLSSFVNQKSLAPLPSSLQPYEEKGRYYNEPEESLTTQKSFFSIIFYLFKGSFCAPSLGDLSSWHRVEWKGPERSLEPRITWMGHSALLIQVEGINLLLDPTYGFIIPCFIRHTEEPIPFEKLPPIDVLAISHNHADHFDPGTLKRLAKRENSQPPIAFVPHRLEEWFQKNGYVHVFGKKWWERSRIEREGRKLTLTAIPARHWSRSNLSDTNHSLWMGVMIEGEDYKIYFAGDTGFDSKMFEEIRHQFGPIDIALLPIAPEGYGQHHLNLEQALDAFELLGAKKMIPIHYGAYRMGTEKIEEPLIHLLQTIQARGLEERVIPLPLGGTYTEIT